MTALPHSLAAFRICRHGHGIICYTAVLEASGRDAIVSAINHARQAAALRAGPPSPYGVLDVIDTAGDIISDYQTPSHAAWRRLSRAFELRPTSSDCAACEAAAFAASHNVVPA